jgi:uncharacterized LabA/DUF88 family protein
MNERLIIAIYFDLENIPKELDINKLLDNISLDIEEDKQAVFAIKLACGETNAITKFRNQLRDNNFEIREAPHVSERNIKNRADLILSMEAFETLVNAKPEIDLYVFITSDTDFTVVMDKLRKYGKQVWLVTNEKVMNNKLFSNSSDNILSIHDSFIIKEKNNESKERDKPNKIDGFSIEHERGIFQVLESLEKDVWHPYSIFGTKIKNLYKDFTYKGKNYNSQTKLFERLKTMGIIEIEKRGATNYFKVM